MLNAPCRSSVSCACVSPMGRDGQERSLHRQNPAPAVEQAATVIMAGTDPGRAPPRSRLDSTSVPAAKARKPGTITRRGGRPVRGKGAHRFALVAVVLLQATADRCGGGEGDGSGQCGSSRGRAPSW